MEHAKLHPRVQTTAERSAESKLSYTPPQMTQAARTRLQVDVRRQQLLELGLEMFGTQSYDVLSIDEIARKAGISKGLLYHYFPSKRAFYVETVREAARQLLEETAVEPESGRPEPDPEGVRMRLRAFIDYASRRRLVYVFLLGGGVGTDTEVVEIIERTRQTLVDRMLVRLAPFGAKADDPATRIRLRGWLGFLESTSLDWLQNESLPKEEFVEVLAQMAGVVLTAILSPPEP